MDSLVIFGAKYLFAAIPFIFLMAVYKASPKHRKQLIVAVVIAGLVAAILDKLSSKLYYDPRPFVTHHVKPLVAHAADNGFPSEHTLLSFTVAGVIYLYRKKMGELALGIALLVGISRIAAHVHSPIDIIGSIIFGLAAAYSGVWLANRYLPKG